MKKASLKPLDPKQALKLDLKDLPWKEDVEYLWYDAEKLTLAGKGWPDESRRYERFPIRAEGKLPERPWRQSLACAGLSLRFESDAPFFFLRWIDYDGVPNVSQLSINSPSLYVKHQGRWQWLGIAKQIDDSPVHKLINGAIAPVWRDYILYLPLLRGMKKLWIAIPVSSAIKPSPLSIEKPVVFYGTSITHGGNASRPGTNHVALLERHFDYPFITLGVSGSAKMEPEVIDLINELDAHLFVIDCLPNMVAADVRANFASAIRKLRAGHPAAPIVIVESVIYQDAFLIGERYDRYTASNAAQRDEFVKLAASGVAGLHYIQARELFTDVNEATFDGTHPNDLGFRLMADAFIKVLTPLLPTNCDNQLENDDG